MGRESSIWVVEASIAQFTSRLPWQGCDPGCRERETWVKWYFQENPPSYDGRTYTGGKRSIGQGHTCLMCDFVPKDSASVCVLNFTAKNQKSLCLFYVDISVIFLLSFHFRNSSIFSPVGIMWLCCKRFNSPGKKDLFKKYLLRGFRDPWRMTHVNNSNPERPLSISCLTCPEL